MIPAPTLLHVLEGVEKLKAALRAQGASGPYVLCVPPTVDHEKIKRFLPDDVALSEDPGPPASFFLSPEPM